jgi:hypothetical protein
MQPPPLAMIAHGEMSPLEYFKFNRRRLKLKTVQPRHPFAQPVRNRPIPSPSALRLFPFRIPLIRSERGTDVPPERFRHRTAISYCYEFGNAKHLESARQRAHRRRFARPPRILIRAGLKSRGRCERSKRYSMLSFLQRK